MRALVSASIIIFILITSWLAFTSYSENTISDLIDFTNNSLIYNVRNAEWNNAALDFNKFHKSWEEYRNVADIFLSSESLNAVDYTLERAENYIEVREAPAAINELAYLTEQLHFLTYNERLCLGNLF